MHATKTTQNHLLALLITASVLLVSPRALASPAAHSRFTSGIKGTYAAGIGHGPTIHQGGGGPFFEAALISGWLELELGVRLLGNEHGALLPISLVAKLPVPVHPKVHGYVGLGPALVPAFGGGDSALHYGLETVIGAYFSLGDPWSILVEGGFGMLREHGSTVHELMSSLGVAYRF